MSEPLFSHVALAPRDPILGLNEAFNADSRSTKVNLGVGVYFDENGRIPVLRAVREAEKLRGDTSTPRGYLPIEGIAAYDIAVQKLLFGADASLLSSGRLVTAQALGGTGGLKIGADFLKRFLPQARVMISDPSWENHRALFEAAGFEVSYYPYYDAANHGLNFSGMLDALANAPRGTIVVLHACCHNPTGVDLTQPQWDRVIQVCATKGLMPFLDMAYQGFGDGIESDGAAVRAFAAADLTCFIASSFSKSFSLYGERVGALTIVTDTKDEATRVMSQLKRVIRSNYSTPPTHGGAVIAAVLSDDRLKSLWEEDLSQMRDRIKQMREALIAGLEQRKVPGDYSFVRRQRGMFSYSGLDAAQVERLRNDYGIYAVSTGRICVAALNMRNLGPVCDAIAAVAMD